MRAASDVVLARFVVNFWTLGETMSVPGPSLDSVAAAFTARVEELQELVLLRGLNRTALDHSPGLLQALI